MVVQVGYLLRKEEEACQSLPARRVLPCPLLLEEELEHPWRRFHRMVEVEGALQRYRQQRVAEAPLV